MAALKDMVFIQETSAEKEEESEEKIICPYYKIFGCMQPQATSGKALWSHQGDTVME